MTDRLLLLEELARAVATPSGAPAAERACRRVVDLLGARGGALTVDPCGPDRVAAYATDLVAARLGEIEEMVGDGPGLRAFREDRSVATVLDPLPPAAAGASGPDRLPVYAVLAAEAVGEVVPVAVRSWPVRTRGGGVATLTVHGLPVRRGADVVLDGQVLADALAPTLLAGAAEVDRARSQVRRAVGMVVAQTGLAVADAAALLRARAWAQEMTVVDLAAAVLARCVTLGDDDGTSAPASG